MTLLVDGCELADLSTVGEGKHLRFRVRQHGRDSGSAIAFGFGAQLDRFRREQRYDVAVRLQENHWNGVVSPQLVVRRIFDAADGFDELRDWLAGQWRAGEDAWTPEARAIFSELELQAGARRSLLESPTFRALLDSEAAAAAGRLTSHAPLSQTLSSSRSARATRSTFLLLAAATEHRREWFRLRRRESCGKCLGTLGGWQ